MSIKKFNQQKEGVRSVIRYVKAIEISLRKPQTILVGSSRVHDGINPAMPVLQQYTPVYNYGIDMLRINEAKKYLLHAIANTKVKRVIFGLDFFMFNALEKYNPAFDSTLVGRQINYMDIIRPSLPSKYVITDIINTVKISYTQPDRFEFRNNGYRPGNAVFYHLKDYKKLHYYTNRTFLSNTSSTPYYGRYKVDEQTFKCFEEYLDICRKNKIECILFITPAHALLDGEGLHLTGLWGNMEDFKRRITHIATLYNTSLWDFSGYNYVTTEKLATPMKHYWDSSHFKEPIGNLMISQMLDPQKKDPLYFGTLLSDSNVEEHLEQIRKDRIVYLQKNKEDVKWLNDLYKLIQDHKPIPKSETENIFF
ncbi:hypothetical protein ACFQZS_05770 [Mucilaginibacter calamicampi]|uniref:Uncharacterized protein n=1 Tax=Mucilaginibacter calamicampi TaxID=1302352 RepID=A0ABW2YTJ5_9SPHI